MRKIRTRITPNTDTFHTVQDNLSVVMQVCNTVTLNFYRALYSLKHFYMESNKTSALDHTQIPSKLMTLTENLY